MPGNQPFEPQETIDSSTLEGKVLCGYQGWFRKPGDGGFQTQKTIWDGEKGEWINVPNDDDRAMRWSSWNRRGVPRLDESGKPQVTVEMYPDVYEYPPECVEKSELPDFPDGRPAVFYSAYREETIDLHFKWMREYGIDGVSLERFLVSALWDTDHNNKVVSSIRNACEKYGRVFIICYDMSGSDNADYVESFKADFEENLERKLDLFSSERYLRHEGKPVVQIWGMGVIPNYKRKPDESLEILRFLKEKGYYIIGGTPTGWRGGTLKDKFKDTSDGFEKVFACMDTISPWTVGRFKTPGEAATHYGETIAADDEFLKKSGQGHMPVIYPGFAWSLWNGGEVNAVPRIAGEFMKKQMDLVRGLKPLAVYAAMFDEYNEATVLAKTASDSSEIPAGTYFLTLSADGTYVSSDYYLRLTGAFTKSFRERKGDPLSVALSTGPRWFVSGFEEGMDPMPQEDSYGVNSGRWASAVVTQGKARSGKYALRVTDGPLVRLIHKIGATVSGNTFLSYYVNHDGRAADVLVDCVLDGDERLSSLTGPFYSDAGSPGVWQKIEVRVGGAAKGRRIEYLTVSRSENGGEAFIDDIRLEDR